MGLPRSSNRYSNKKANTPFLDMRVTAAKIEIKIDIKTFYLVSFDILEIP